jgi:hypothetical protein
MRTATRCLRPQADPACSHYWRSYRPQSLKETNDRTNSTPSHQGKGGFLSLSPFTATTCAVLNKPADYKVIPPISLLQKCADAFVCVPALRDTLHIAVDLIHNKDDATVSLMTRR